MDIKNPRATKKFKASMDLRGSEIYFIIEAKTEEHAILLLIKELELLGVPKPYECAMQDYFIREVLPHS